MESTCRELLDYCLRGESWPADLLDRALAVDEGRAFLSVVVERLGDLFEPRLVAVYEKVFVEAIQWVAPELLLRIRVAHEASKPPENPERVYVLSRITLGADVAVTSVLLDAAKRRYPDAAIILAGPRKSYELFENDPRVGHLETPYARSGSLAGRLQASAALWIDDGIVIDPDSRLTQLGLILICDPGRYFFFNSRAYGEDGTDRLPDLAARWAEEIFGIKDARPYIAPLPSSGEPFGVTVSLGVGENSSKRFDDEFERQLLLALRDTGQSILVDKGGSGEERARVERVLSDGMHTHDGAFAPFAAEIARSRLYAGYDSAGGHVASACGVASVTVFAGFVSERMFQRWQPNGIVIRGDDPDPLDAVRRALNRFKI